MKNRKEIAEAIKSRYLILMPSGKEMPFDVKDEADVRNVLSMIDDNELASFIISEEVKGQPKKEPPSIKAMQQQQLVGYEPASDSGHFRLYPKGKLVFDLLKDWADEIALNRL